MSQSSFDTLKALHAHLHRQVQLEQLLRERGVRDLISLHEQFIQNAGKTAKSKSRFDAMLTQVAALIQGHEERIKRGAADENDVQAKQLVSKLRDECNKLQAHISKHQSILPADALPKLSPAEEAQLRKALAVEPAVAAAAADAPTDKAAGSLTAPAPAAAAAAAATATTKPAVRSHCLAVYATVGGALLAVGLWLALSHGHAGSDALTAIRLPAAITNFMATTTGVDDAQRQETLAQLAAAGERHKAEAARRAEEYARKAQAEAEAREVERVEQLMAADARRLEKERKEKAAAALDKERKETAAADTRSTASSAKASTTQQQQQAQSGTQEGAPSSSFSTMVIGAGVLTALTVGAMLMSARARSKTAGATATTGAKSAQQEEEEGKYGRYVANKDGEGTVFTTHRLNPKN